MKAGSLCHTTVNRTFKGMIRFAAFFLLSFFLWGGTAMKLTAQTNLVLNPSFEDTIQCVNTHSRFQGYVADWRGNDGEYYSLFCQGFQVGIPSNAVGYQFPRTGSAMAGIYTIINDNIPTHENYRDYIEGQLSSPLDSGRNYEVVFYVNLSNYSQFVTQIGFAFSSDTLSYNKECKDFLASNNDFNLASLSDTLNWYQLRRSFQSSGGEKYLVIGSFINDTNSSFLQFNPSAIYPACYYYIDDVAVYEISEARPGLGDTICPGDSVQLGEIFQPGVRYNWSPGATLSDSTAAFPVAFPTQTTTYTLAISDTSGRYYPGDSVATVTVYVDECPPPPVEYDYFVPTLLSGEQPFISGNLPPNTTYYLYDARGRLLIRHDNYDNSERASRFAAGMYIWQLHLPDGSIQSGKVTILR